jgi:putative methionine-R-sulfoxide reductase with GAF domain
MNRWVRMSKSAAQTRQAQDYSRVLVTLSSALSSEPLAKALTTSVRILRESSDHFDWVGIYLVRENDLVLEAYAGDEETEHVRIPIGQGICGSAAKEGATIVVPDVSKDPQLSHVLRRNPIRDRCSDKGIERGAW